MILNASVSELPAFREEARIFAVKRHQDCGRLASARGALIADLFFSVFLRQEYRRVNCLAGRLMNQLRADLNELPDGVLISLPDRIVAHCFLHVKRLPDYFLNAFCVW